MKIKKRYIFLAIIIIAIAVVVGVIIYHGNTNQNSLSNEEKKWVDNNSSKVISISIPNINNAIRWY